MITDRENMGNFENKDKMLYNKNRSRFVNVYYDNHQNNRKILLKMFNKNNVEEVTVFFLLIISD